MSGSTSAGKSLTRASLAIHEPPIGYGTTPGSLIETLHFDYNPSQLTLSRRAEWKTTPSAAVRSGAVPEFMGPVPRDMTVDLLLDRSATPDSRDVLKNVELLLSCCETTAASITAKQPSPPWVVFDWGGNTTVGFTAYVSSVEVQQVQISSTGLPTRALCRVQLNEIPSKTAGQNPTSGALTAKRVHRVVAGDSLPFLAWREYGDATAWRTIAEANGIDDPAQLHPGTELMLPAAEEVGA
ncbi:CIS tube protein [Streptacidiphilus cavernicola]|uniref:LysM peptidoglycan-binding domain-containing protein n=1 Tax=Streptacidiphilus cavernicola TaxID=3342716 RepID=A0ABV6VWR4_9ACTN